LVVCYVIYNADDVPIYSEPFGFMITQGSSNFCLDERLFQIAVFQPRKGADDSDYTRPDIACACHATDFPKATSIGLTGLKSDFRFENMCSRWPHSDKTGKALGQGPSRLDLNLYCEIYLDFCKNLPKLMESIGSAITVPFAEANELEKCVVIREVKQQGHQRTTRTLQWHIGIEWISIIGIFHAPSWTENFKKNIYEPCTFSMEPKVKIFDFSLVFDPQFQPFWGVYQGVRCVMRKQTCCGNLQPSKYVTCWKCLWKFIIVYDNGLFVPYYGVPCAGLKDNAVSMFPMVAFAKAMSMHGIARDPREARDTVLDNLMPPRELARSMTALRTAHRNDRASKFVVMRKEYMMCLNNVRKFYSKVRAYVDNPRGLDGAEQPRLFTRDANPGQMAAEGRDPATMRKFMYKAWSEMDEDGIFDITSDHSPFAPPVVVDSVRRTRGDDPFVRIMNSTISEIVAQAKLDDVYGDGVFSPYEERLSALCFKVWLQREHDHEEHERFHYLIADGVQDLSREERED